MQVYWRRGHSHTVRTDTALFATSLDQLSTPHQHSADQVRANTHISIRQYSNIINYITSHLYCLRDEVFLLKIGKFTRNACVRNLALLANMSVLIMGPKWTLAASHAAFWWVTLMWICRRDRQADSRTDVRPLHYAFRYRCGQYSNGNIIVRAKYD